MRNADRTRVYCHKKFSLQTLNIPDYHSGKGGLCFHNSRMRPIRGQDCWPFIHRPISVIHGRTLVHELLFTMFCVGSPHERRCFTCGSNLRVEILGCMLQLTTLIRGRSITEYEVRTMLQLLSNTVRREIEVPGRPRENIRAQDDNRVEIQAVHALRSVSSLNLVRHEDRGCLALRVCLGCIEAVSFEIVSVWVDGARSMALRSIRPTMSREWKAGVVDCLQSRTSNRTRRNGS